MNFRDFKENAAEIWRVAGILLQVYTLAILPFFIFGTGRSLSDFGMMGVIAVPVFGGALIVQAGLLAVYLACLPFRVLHRVATARGGKPLRKKGVGDPEFDL
jgi:hypothetical protein